MMTLGLRLSSHTPSHADADDSEHLLETFAVSGRRFHESDLKPPARARRILCAPKLLEQGKNIETSM